MVQPHDEARAPTVAPLISVLVEGASMFPVLLSRDKVLVKRSTLGELRLGDIIVWADESDEHIAHRVIAIDPATTPPLVITQGDLCVDPDPPVTMDRVLGKIMAVLRQDTVQWIKDLDQYYLPTRGNGTQVHQLPHPLAPDRPKPTYRDMRVLDLRDISAASIREIGQVEDIGLVLLSPENAESWGQVPTRDVHHVVTAPPDYRVYTGQPELLPELLAFTSEPLRLVVVGQLFLTAFTPDQIRRTIGHLILIGQALVQSVSVQNALEPVTRIVSGGIDVIAHEHVRWIGASVLGPEYLAYRQQHQPLVVLGDLTVSPRLVGTPAFNEIPLVHVGRS